MISFTAKGQGYYRVLVDDVEISKHVTEREALESAVNHVNDGLNVRVIHDYEVQVKDPSRRDFLGTALTCSTFPMLLSACGSESEDMSTITITSPGIPTPDQFTLNNQSGVTVSSQIESNSITVTGLYSSTVTVAISVDIGQYQINNSGIWLTDPSTVKLNDTVIVRHQSSNLNLTPTVQTLTIGGVQDTFTSTTQASGEAIPTTDLSQVTRRNVTWTFDNTYPVGQFVNGDYFVVAPSGLTITSVSPDWNGTGNGSMSNPVYIGGPFQGFDSRTIAGVDRFSAALRISFPYAASVNESICSSVSGDTGDDFWSGAPHGSNGCWINSIEVLTILSESPPVNSYRPSPSDLSKTLYNKASLDTSIFPNHPSAGLGGINKHYFSWTGTDIEYLERVCERYWPMFGDTTWGMRFLKAKDHFVNNYWEQIGDSLAQVIGMCCTDARTETMVDNLAQVLIDNYYAFQTDSVQWSIMIPLGGALLQDATMKNHWINNPPGTSTRDHEKFYWLGDSWSTRYASTSAVVPAGVRWHDYVGPLRSSDGTASAFRKAVGSEYEHLAPSEWACAGAGGECKDEQYKGSGECRTSATFMTAQGLIDAVSADDWAVLCANSAAVAQLDCWRNEDMTSIYDRQGSGRTHIGEIDFYHGTGITGSYGGITGAFMSDLYDTYLA